MADEKDKVEDSMATLAEELSAVEAETEATEEQKVETEAAVDEV